MFVKRLAVLTLLLATKGQTNPLPDDLNPDRACAAQLMVQARADGIYASESNRLKAIDPDDDEATARQNAVVRQAHIELKAAITAYDACAAQVTKQRTDRLAAATKANLDALRAIPAHRRLPEEHAVVLEAEREAGAAVVKERNDRVDMLADPAMRARVWSAMRCAYVYQRGDAFKEIEQQRRYARIGGVQNLGAIYHQQQIIRLSDRRIAELQTRIKDAKRSVESCAKAEIKLLTVCLYQHFNSNDLDEVCSRADVPRVIKAIDEDDSGLFKP